MEEFEENLQEETAVESWWHVDDDMTETGEPRGAAMLMKRCIQAHKWDEAYARSVLLAYRQYMELKTVFEDWEGLILFPTKPVAQMWMQHMQDARSYNNDCKLLCGRVVGYHLDKASDTASKKKRIETTKIAVIARFGKEVDTRIWSIPKSALPQTKPTYQPPESGTPAPPSKPTTIVSPEQDMSIEQKEVMLEDSIPTDGGDNGHSEEPPETLKLRLIGCGTELHILVLSNEPLGRAFESFAEHKNLEESTLRFYSSGRRIFEDQTPQSVDLGDCDVVNVIRFTYHRSDF